MEKAKKEYIISGIILFGILILGNALFFVLAYYKPL